MNRRIVFVAPFGLGQKTTIWARTLPMAQFLARHGDTVAILVPPWDTPADAATVTASENVRIENMSLDGGMIALWRRLLGRAKQLDPDILHVVKPIGYSGLVHWWLWQEHRFAHATCRIILDIDDWEQAWIPINGYPWPIARFLAWQENWGIRHAHGITAASRWLVERAQATSPAIPRLYLPNGISSRDLPVRNRRTARPRSDRSNSLFLKIRRNTSGLACRVLCASIAPQAIWPTFCCRQCPATPSRRAIPAIFRHPCRRSGLNRRLAGICRTIRIEPSLQRSDMRHLPSPKYTPAPGEMQHAPCNDVATWSSRRRQRRRGTGVVRCGGCSPLGPSPMPHLPSSPMRSCDSSPNQTGAGSWLPTRNSVCWKSTTGIGWAPIE